MTTQLEPDGLTTTIDGEAHLVGARCTDCGTHVFPVQAACPRCGATTEPVALPRNGTLWSWTVQRLPPKPPYDGPTDRDEFEPFAVGYVDLGPLRVESRLEGRAVDSWTIGEPLTLAACDPDDEGRTWRYRFVAAGGEA